VITIHEAKVAAKENKNKTYNRSFVKIAMATQRQASPFRGEDYIKIGELLSGYDQAKKSNHFADPLSPGDYQWVTVIFPEDIDYKTLTDVKLIYRVRKEIRAGRATIGPISLHGLGKKCFSLPIKTVQPTAIESLKQAQLSKGEKLKRAQQGNKETIKQAVTLVNWWIQRIRKYDAEVDQDLIFKTKCGPWVGQRRIFANIPDNWKKPSFGGPD
jgi:hypothetical protein